MNAVHSFASHLSLQRMAHDRAKDLVPMADDLVARYPAVVAWRVARAYFYWKSGRLEEARVLYAGIVGEPESAIPGNEQWAITACLLAELCAALGDERDAAWIQRQLLPGIDQYCVVGMGVAVHGSIARRLGLLATQLGSWDDAERYFAHALELEERSESPPAAAQVLADHAAMLERRGRPADRGRARAFRGRARSIAKQLGAAGLVPGDSAPL
jgi:hypothetical protein